MFLVRKLSREKKHETLRDSFKTLAPRRQVARETKVLRQNDWVFPDVFQASKWCGFSQLRRHLEKPREKWWLQPLGKVFSDYLLLSQSFVNKRCGLKVHSTKKRNSKYFWERSVKHFESARGQTPWIPAFVDWYPSAPQFLLSHKFYETNFHGTLSFIKSREADPLIQLDPRRTCKELLTPPPPPVFSISIGQKFYFKKRKSLRSKLLASKQWGQISMAEMKQNHLQPHVTG